MWLFVVGTGHFAAMRRSAQMDMHAGEGWMCVLPFPMHKQRNDCGQRGSFEMGVHVQMLRNLHICMITQTQIAHCYKDMGSCDDHLNFPRPQLCSREDWRKAGMKDETHGK